MDVQQAGPRLAVPVTDRDHIQGPENAPVTLVEYGDYECSYCGEAYWMIKQVQRQFGDELRFVFRNFPLPDSHPHAVQAAEAAEAAGEQGEFWPMHDTLYENRDALDTADLTEYARTLDLDLAEFEQALRDHREIPRIQEDADGGVRSGVPGTPTFYINDVQYQAGFDAESLEDAIAAAKR